MLNIMLANARGTFLVLSMPEDSYPIFESKYGAGFIYWGTR
jgi:hypothetical protein